LYRIKLPVSAVCLRSFQIIKHPGGASGLGFHRTTWDYYKNPSFITRAYSTSTNYPRASTESRYSDSRV